MGETCTEFSHLVDLIHTLSGEEVETVEVLIVMREVELAVGSLYRDDCLVDRALAILNPLAHRVQVGGEVARCGEDTLAILAFALTVELLPPFGDKVELGLIVDHNLNLLATFIVESVAHGSILCSDILAERHIHAGSLLHISSTSHESLDVETSTGYRQQTHGSEHREAATHVVGNDEALVAFLVGTGACGTALGIGNSHYHLTSHVLAQLGLTLLLEQTESEGGLGSGTRLGDIDDAEALALQIVGELSQIVLADIVAGKENLRVLLVLNEPGKRVAEGFDDSARAEVAAADAGYHYYLTLLSESIGNNLDFIEEIRSNT